MCGNFILCTHTVYVVLGKEDKKFDHRCIVFTGKYLFGHYCNIYYYNCPEHVPVARLQNLLNLSYSAIILLRIIKRDLLYSQDLDFYNKVKMVPICKSYKPNL